MIIIVILEKSLFPFSANVLPNVNRNTTIATTKKVTTKATTPKPSITPDIGLRQDDPNRKKGL